MSDQYDPGTAVKWKWGNGEASGVIDEVFTSKVTRTIEGTEVTRNADEENPAYIVKQEGGDRALKSHSEVEVA